jgi:hypothetical protein
MCPWRAGGDTRTSPELFIRKDTEQTLTPPIISSSYRTPNIDQVQGDSYGDDGYFIHRDSDGEDGSNDGGEGRDGTG